MTSLAEPATRPMAELAAEYGLSPAEYQVVTCAPFQEEIGSSGSRLSWRIREISRSRWDTRARWVACAASDAMAVRRSYSSWVRPEYRPTMRSGSRAWMASKSRPSVLPRTWGVAVPSASMAMSAR